MVTKEKFKKTNNTQIPTIQFIWQLDAQGRLTATPCVTHQTRAKATPGAPRAALTTIGSIVIERQRLARALERVASMASGRRAARIQSLTSVLRR